MDDVKTVDENPYASPREDRSHAEVQSPVSGAPHPLRIWLWWSARRGIIGGVVAGCLLFLMSLGITAILNGWTVFWFLLTDWSNLKSLVLAFLLMVLLGCAISGVSALFLGLIAYGLQKFRYREWILFLLCLILSTLPVLILVSSTVLAGGTIDPGPGMVSAFAILLSSGGVGIYVFSLITGTLFRSRDSTDPRLLQESSSS
ncbi:hypothetical protein M4951_20185 [Blastopirellula sp. J2-11]|uniref:hypothetical protein n=1 Tax=Blastopirellula sp. J2-11 TaxID=2943192 RepID=UPI0021C880E7|nr:hypothetical protein [Blastopirellula sp. J2-11]UUO05682.1 hypothetical protein M4951_20185 [Blastopirellula sp. J2-11]